VRACECAREIDSEEKLNFQFAYKQRWNQADVNNDEGEENK